MLFLGVKFMKNLYNIFSKEVNEMTEEEKKRNDKRGIVTLIVLLLFIGVMVYACNYKTPEERSASKADLEASKAASEQRTDCVVAAEQEVDKYISGAKYPRDEDWQIQKITDDSGIEMWQIGATISITNVVEKQPILIIITIIDDNHYTAHYVSVGNKVYFDDNKVSFNDGTTD